MGVGVVRFRGNSLRDRESRPKGLAAVIVVIVFWLVAVIVVMVSVGRSGATAKNEVIFDMES